MPGTYLEIEQIRESLTRQREISQNGFNILVNICRLVDEADSKRDSQELILRALENRAHFGEATVVLDSLVRKVGLFPYLDLRTLCAADAIALECNRPANMGEDIVFHGPQSKVYRALIEGRSVILSAPTSFGKSLITDAVVASGKFKNILIVVPTIALIDETRRRLSRRFGQTFKIITHASQETSARNIFVLTQERVLERNVLEGVEFVVIDEFYKLSPEREEDDRCARLNEVFYRVLKSKKQFYLLGPNVQGVPERVRRRLKCEEFYEDYRTVVSEIHDVSPGEDPLAALTSLCSKLQDPTIVFCSSPNSAAEVARALIAFMPPANQRAIEAANWVAQHYHPEWHFVRGLRRGIGIHHGRVPRALAHYVVEAFNSDILKILVCTSTLIEGVNTKAKNVIIFDDRINQKNIDFFTFNNIKGRSGRMGRHFIGHVYLFYPPPTEELPFVDIPAISQPDDATPGLLMQLDDDDLTARSKNKLQAFLEQEFLDYETLKRNFGIDPQTQIEIAKRILADPIAYAPTLQWTGIPSFRQIYAICNLIWAPFNCVRKGAGSARTPNQLGVKLIQLHSAPSTKELIAKSLEYVKDPDEAVSQTLDFLRLWGNFHFPQFLRCLDRIQKDVFRRLHMRAGDYELYASKIENRFVDPPLIALEEYGVPLEIGLKLRKYLRPYTNIDDVIGKLRHLPLEKTNLSGFEMEIASQAQTSI
jgi:hypothetical protein